MTIEPLHSLGNLRVLGLGETSIRDASLFTLQGLTGLESLYLKNDKLTDLSPLASLVNLQILDVRGNCIEDFTPVDHVSNVSGDSDQGCIQ